MTTLILTLILFAAVLIDSRSHKIPNILTGSGLLAGLVLSLAAPHSPIGLLPSLLGVLLGFLFLLPGYALSRMGAGDVKLMAMCGSFLGPHGIVDAGVLTLIAGGVLAGLWLLMQKVTQPAAASDSVATLSGCVSAGDGSGLPVWKQRFPYALAIAVGCYAVMYTPFTLFSA